MSRFGTSQPLSRLEDPRLLLGAGRYIDDAAPQDGLERTLHAVFVRSPVAHAEIAAIDLVAARASSGVAAIFTGADLSREGVNHMARGNLAGREGTAAAACPVRPLLAGDKVRHVGEAVALVLAETPEAARDAAERVDVRWNPLDAVVEKRRALEPDAPQIHADAPGNLAFDWATGDKAETEAAFARSSHHVALELANNKVIAAPMEPRGVLAKWDSRAGKLTLETNSQGVWPIKSELIALLGLRAEQVRVKTGDVGGGFGMKGVNYPEQLALGWAARKIADRPLRWIADRSESFLTDVMGRDHESLVEGAFDENFRLRAYRITTLAGMGAHLSPFAVYIPTRAGCCVLTGCYDVQTAYCNVRGVFTNTTPIDAYRGAGRPEAIYAIERLMDKASRMFGMDPAALHKINFIKPEQFPYRTASGELYDVGNFSALIDRAAGEIGRAGFETRRKEARARGRLRGLGISSYIESILGDASETTRLHYRADGLFALHVGTQSNGQGHETVYAQILHERIGVPPEQILIVQGDSDQIETGGGTGGSRSVTTQGVSINAAGDALIDNLLPHATQWLESPPEAVTFSDGLYRAQGSNRTVPLAHVAAQAQAQGESALLNVRKTTTLPGRSYPSGCHMAEVEIDPETGATRILDYQVADDFGTLINPMLAEGQVHGGVAQGVGQALMEHVVYDRDGQLLSGSFMDYAMPRAADLPMIGFHSEPTLSTANPIGMKGCGEAGTVGTLAALVNAVLDALWPLGVRHIDMPLTPNRVWTWIQNAKAANGSGH